MKKMLILVALSVATIASAQTKKIYLNAGHGGWSPNDRPMATIPYPMLETTGRPDTCGFYESNTNLWKIYELGTRLKKTGNYRIKYSRVRNGPYPWVSGASNEAIYDKPLANISAEVDSYKADLFLSVHSNAAGEASITNYPLFLYRGLDGQEATVGSYDICSTLWDYHIENLKSSFELWTAYKDSKNIRGDRSFYNYTWQNTKGYFGYLGVLMHASPGCLVEGYFHTYQPARHRALNQDWCRMEGQRYYRGIQKYFGYEPDTTGSIMGCIRTKAQLMSRYGSNYTYNTTAFPNDQYLPLNGAEVRLMAETGGIYYVVKTYKVDNNFNGIFSFTDLKPGVYYIEYRADGYTTKQNKGTRVTVKANETAYKFFFMTPGTSTEFLPADDLETAIHHVAEEDFQQEAGQYVDRMTVRIYDSTGKYFGVADRRDLETMNLPAGIYLLENNGRSVKYVKR